jgi:hypothetical protein
MMYRVIFYEEGEDVEPIIEDMTSFADAWALAQPAPEEMEEGWRTIVTREEAQERIKTGVLTVASDPEKPNKNYTTIQEMWVVILSKGYIWDEDKKQTWIVDSFDAAWAMTQTLLTPEMAAAGWYWTDWTEDAVAAQRAIKDWGTTVVARGPLDHLRDPVGSIVIKRL